MGKIDQLTNEYMSDKARFADVFNYFVYDGRQVLIPEYLHELSTVEQVFPYGKDGKTHEVQRFRDVLKNACVMTDEQERTYILLGMEGEKVDVCKAIEQIRKEAIEEGDKHGEEKGILNSIRNLMETTSWTAQAAMDALKIPEADRAGYLAKL